MAITVLIHSSKTMRSSREVVPSTSPALIHKTRPLAAYLQTLTTAQLQTTMKISGPLADKVHDSFAAWNDIPDQQLPALDSFVGDIYSGFHASTLTRSDRDYAQQSLRILSGLYGILRPNDGVRPYRLEMGYRLPDLPFRSLYAYWGMDIAQTLPKENLIINLSAAEYTKTVLPYVDRDRVISPRFLTVHAKTGRPRQVIVHTKIARGAFARWLMTSRITSPSEMVQFNDLGYQYVAALSTSLEPTFACETFGGIGLSVRLQKM